MLNFWIQSRNLFSDSGLWAYQHKNGCWFSSIREGTPSKNIKAITQFNNCLAKERLLSVIKVLVTGGNNSTSKSSILLPLSEWEHGHVRAQLISHSFSFPLSRTDFESSASVSQAHLYFAVKPCRKKLEEKLPWDDKSGPEIWDNCRIQDPLGSALISVEWYVLRVLWFSILSYMYLWKNFMDDFWCLHEGVMVISP